MLKTSLHFVAALAVTLAAGAVFTAQAQTPASPAPPAGITINGGSFSGSAEAREATPADLGLPVYPGAVPQHDKPGDGAGANLGLRWSNNGSSTGFSLAVLKFSSSASLTDVAAYYRNALARYGSVLDCSGTAASRNEPLADSTVADKTVLRCGKDGGKPGELLYKVGTRQHARTVSLQPAADGGVRFQLVRLELPSD